MASVSLQANKQSRMLQPPFVLFRNLTSTIGARTAQDKRHSLIYTDLVKFHTVIKFVPFDTFPSRRSGRTFFAAYIGTDIANIWYRRRKVYLQLPKRFCRLKLQPPKSRDFSDILKKLVFSRQLRDLP